MNLNWSNKINQVKKLVNKRKNWIQVTKKIKQLIIQKKRLKIRVVLKWVNKNVELIVIYKNKIILINKLHKKGRKVKLTNRIKSLKVFLKMKM
jgi:hypothetical protein